MAVLTLYDPIIKSVCAKRAQTGPPQRPLIVAADRATSTARKTWFLVEPSGFVSSRRVHRAMRGN